MPSGVVGAVGASICALVARISLVLLFAGRVAAPVATDARRAVSPLRSRRALVGVSLPAPQFFNLAVGEVGSGLVELAIAAQPGGILAFDHASYIFRMEADLAAAMLAALCA
jgi:hypothetical protein